MRSGYSVPHFCTSLHTIHCVILMRDVKRTDRNLHSARLWDTWVWNTPVVHIICRALLFSDYEVPLYTPTNITILAHYLNTDKFQTLLVILSADLQSLKYDSLFVKNPLLFGKKQIQIIRTFEKITKYLIPQILQKNKNNNEW